MTSDTQADSDAQAEARRNAYARVPFTRMLGVQREFSHGGQARLVIEARPELQNVIGAVHGGVILTMLDVAMASAAVSLVDFTKTAVTLNMNSSFLRPGLGRVVVDGQALEVNDGVVSCAAQALDAQGELVASALGSFRYLPLPAAP
ncbi:PaaI family thioesterase [Pseudorhodoferax sp. Leaf267]|uniref:PaaI family thioesterase n=1 Tax=Pseudorhodoferax sp. Leaf267 TaxID=1736316 RepID=UPI0006FE7DCC|nr:PaaI family thioesterase [Pseudorhodoferax sp. Leaf267]KQP22447.1 thioesterase [Pseudorhodoferax sp. Leaf267]